MLELCTVKVVKTLDLGLHKQIPSYPYYGCRGKPQIKRQKLGKVSPEVGSNVVPYSLALSPA